MGFKMSGFSPFNKGQAYSPLADYGLFGKKKKTGGKGGKSIITRDNPNAVRRKKRPMTPEELGIVTKKGGAGA